ncbi:NAP1-related protein [Actinidia chinensis var. chinensis]|uniref:NAP1-related protein n=1 Tax=Actinidia chinensis var. chinensis TaxID=1590841 RepID=A0A2R6RYQ3_ACTCC|nr:NAP1-related protein [Actinidia chinensis var. chinensis]
MVADCGKKLKVVERTEEEDSDHIDSELVLSIEKLQEVQDELDKFNEEASEKVLEVEQKYNEIRRPVFVKRNEIIKSIPDFWLTAFLCHPALCDLLSEEDSKILKYLDSLHVEDFKDVKSGYSITFNFKPNPYFEDTKLTKSFTFFDEGTTKITGTNIKWKEGMGAANGVSHEKKGNKRPPTDESFFSWFSESQQKDIAEGLNDEVAEIIKEDLWPNPLKYFNNEADEEDSDADEDNEEEEKGDDEQEEEEEDGEEEEDN